MYRAEENPSTALDLPGHSTDTETSQRCLWCTLMCGKHTAMGGGICSHSDKPLLRGKKEKKEKEKESGGKTRFFCVSVPEKEVVVAAL